MIGAALGGVDSAGWDDIIDRDGAANSVQCVWRQAFDWTTPELPNEEGKEIGAREMLRTC